MPEAEIITRPRFSILTYAGDSKLHRLPRRSAVVAFSAAEVYALAELLRRQKGGAAVVLGALSPRTRNAQVALYQAGEVDHLVATDAIGMGLNMDVAHVAFAGLCEVRRHASTAGCAQPRWRRSPAAPAATWPTARSGPPTAATPFDAERDRGRREPHASRRCKRLRWRNAELDFASSSALLASLDRAPPTPACCKVRDAVDHRSLLFLSRRDEIGCRRCRHGAGAAAVAGLPDPRLPQDADRAHLHLLATVFGHLTSAQRRAARPTGSAAMIAQLDRTDGDIDALVARDRARPHLDLHVAPRRPG